jgi:hypothetical protein
LMFPYRRFLLLVYYYFFKPWEDPLAIWQTLIYAILIVSNLPKQDQDL